MVIEQFDDFIKLFKQFAFSGGGGAVTEADPLFSEWKSRFNEGDYAKKTDLVIYDTSSQVSNKINKAVSANNEIYYTKADVDRLIGDLQTEGFTQDQINQIIASLPDSDTVTSNELSAAAAKSLTDGKTYTDEQISSMTTQLNNSLQITSENLDTHKMTDRYRWQDNADGERDSFIRDAENAGLKAGVDGIVTVHAVSTPYTVQNEGVIFGVQMRNTESTYCTVIINDTEKYNSEGLTAGVPFTKWFWLNKNDIVIANNAETFYAINLELDQNSKIGILQADSAKAAKERADMKARLLDIEARLDNMTVADPVVLIDSDQGIDITAGGQYSVTNTFGGRITGEGVTTLGLLGLTVLATGIVNVNGNEVYNNTALLGVRPDPLVMTVNQGDVIEAIGMRHLIYTAYVPAGS